MSADRSFVSENDTERARLRALVARLSDADLARPLPANWTVAAVLGHVAFWDQRILLLLALPPRQLADLAVSIAEAVDQKIATLPDDTITRNTSARTPINFHRAEHRRQHLDEIESALR